MNTIEGNYNVTDEEKGYWGHAFYVRVKADDKLHGSFNENVLYQTRNKTEAYTGPKQYRSDGATRTRHICSRVLRENELVEGCERILKVEKKDYDDYIKRRKTIDDFRRKIEVLQTELRTEEQEMKKKYVETSYEEPWNDIDMDRSD